MSYISELYENNKDNNYWRTYIEDKLIEQCIQRTKQCIKNTVKEGKKCTGWYNYLLEGKFKYYATFKEFSPDNPNDKKYISETKYLKEIAKWAPKSYESMLINEGELTTTDQQIILYLKKNPDGPNIMRMKSEITKELRELGCKKSSIIFQYVKNYYEDQILVKTGFMGRKKEYTVQNNLGPRVLIMISVWW
ncbi:MAG: hypothetical protein Q4D45_11855 [Lachnospiraceae bacterium]|nr:hypothetical protein [Lachnospiraceae bacterium]